MSANVLITDYPWPDIEIERRIIEGAGYRLLDGGREAKRTNEIEELVTTYDPDAILTCWAPISAEAVASTSALRVVARMGVGLDNIAVDAATAVGAWVTNVPDYCVEEVSDHAVALVLASTRGVTRFDRRVREGVWSADGAAGLGRLSTRTVGIVGYGRIGRATARKLTAFGCTLLATESSTPDDNALAEQTPLADLLRRSDIVVLHVPLTPHTHHLIDAKALAIMKPNALLVNVGRGGLVDTDALVDALESGVIASAALDVLEEEPDVAAQLAVHPSVVLTPHIAFSSAESLVELRTRAAEDVVRVLDGTTPRNPCNSPASATSRSTH